MTNQPTKQNQVSDWQPGQAVVFEADQPDQPSQPDNPTQVHSSAHQLSSKQIDALKSLTSRLAAVTADLNRLVQSIDLSGQLSSVELNEDSKILSDELTGQTIDGYFDGEKMIASSGQSYLVSANYASKSKLVEGDNLRLTIAHNGNFLYKQIGPIDRRRLIATLEKGSDGQCYAVADHHRWRLLQASVSYFKAEPGDRIAIVIPKDLPSQFAALENLVAE